MSGSTGEERTMLNPSLAPLAVLVGDWRVELTNAEFLESGTSMFATVSIAWLDDAFLVVRSTKPVRHRRCR
jgi:hypothetical protein